jgi:hypothetical protein
LPDFLSRGNALADLLVVAAPIMVNPTTYQTVDEPARRCGPRELILR